MNNILREDFEIILKHYYDDLQFLKNKKMLITGATGLITVYLSLFLIYLSKEFGLEIFLQCRNINKGLKIYKSFLDKSNIHIVNFDFIKEEMPEVKPDFIIHAASPASTKFFIESPVDVLTPNVVGSYNLLKYSKEQRISKFLFFSSNSIYGEGEYKDTLSEEDYGIVDPLNDRAC